MSAPAEAIAWKPYDPCICGCGTVAAKRRERAPFHNHRCTCRSCTGKRNRKAGQKTEYTRHQVLGGQGFTPRDELGKTYDVTVTTQDKRGKQIPASFVQFISSEWTRHALSQAERAVAIGSGAHPSLYLEPPRAGRWLLVKLS